MTSSEESGSGTYQRHRQNLWRLGVFGALSGVVIFVMASARAGELLFTMSILFVVSLAIGEVALDVT